MPQTAEEFCTRQCKYFAANDLTAIADSFSLPAAIYYNDRIAVFEDRKDLIDLLKSKRDMLKSHGYKYTEFRVIAQTLAAGNHFSFWVEYLSYDAADCIIATSTSRYFCLRSANQKLSVQLVEYLKLPTLKTIQDNPIFAVMF